MSEPVTLHKLEAASRHIELIAGIENASVHFRTFHDAEGPGANKIYSNLEDARAQINRLQNQGHGVFFVINDGGDTDNAITDIRAWFADADGLPLDEIKWHVQPDFIVKRDLDHWHAYWLATGCPVQQFRPIQKRLIRHYKSDPAVHNESRVLRLAGTLHLKYGKPGTRLELIDFHPGKERYEIPGHTVEQITAGLPEAPIEDDKAPRAPTGQLVAPEIVEQMLSCIRPSVPRKDWLIVCAGLVAAPVADPDWDGLGVFIRWGRGDLHGGIAPKNYRGDDDCIAQWNRDLEKLNAS